MEAKTRGKWLHCSIREEMRRTLACESYRVYTPVDAGDAWHVLLIADSIRQQPVTNLPRKHRRIISLILANRFDDPRRRHLGLAAADHARLDRTRLVIPTEYRPHMKE